MPSRGSGPSRGPAGGKRHLDARRADQRDGGTSMLPVPRSTLESVLAIHTAIAPAKTTFE